MSINNYNLLAPFYDFVTNLVFNGKVLKAQKDLIKQLPEHGNLLFIGGGTGQTLKYLEQQKPDLKITYIDASSEMIRLSKKHSNSQNTIFILGTENNIPDINYDIICTFFFLDLFKSTKRIQVFNTLNSHLSTNGLWLYADFTVAKKWWQKGIEFMMFQFLKLSTNITTSRIEDYSQHFNKTQFELLCQQRYFGNYISNAIYKKRGVN
jgi:ubiquinone/menaquinone biosynthesis C-methylase UbiE